MTVMRWFRKNNKKLMIGIGVIVMVAFGLPTALFQGGGQKSPTDVIMAHYTDFQGVEHELSMARLQSAEVELDVLQSLNLVGMTIDRGVIRGLSGLQGMSEYPIWAANLVLFPNDAFARQGVALWGQILQQSDWADNIEERNKVGNKIIQMCSVDPGMSVRYFILLAAEARQAGISTSQDQIENMKNQFRLSTPEIPGISINAICQRFNISQKQFDMILGDYIAILRYGDMVTRSLSLSEPHLRHEALNIEQEQNVNGLFVTFPATNYLDKTGEPDLANLQEQLELYKENTVGITDDENPFGFGYKLNDRVRLEYLKVDLETARAAIRARFNALDVRQQEEQLQNYWRTHRDEFREIITPEIPATPATATSPAIPAVPAEYRDLEFDEAIGQVRQRREDDEARRWADRLFAQAKDISLEALNRTELNALSVDERSQKAVNYQTLAEQVSDAELPVSYGATDFMDFVRFSQSDEFMGAYQQRSRGIQWSLANMLFNCKPLYQGVESRLDEPPILLYEDIDAVVTGDSGVYLVRIVEVDKARPPVSLLDDGFDGIAREYPEVSVEAIEQTLSDPNHPLEIYSIYQAVRDDWKAKQALELARRAAMEFAANSETDWDQAIKQYNDRLTADPNDIAAQGKTLWENSLDSMRSQLLQYEQLMSNNMDPQTKQFFQSSMSRMILEIREAMKLAQDLDLDATSRSVMVYEEMQKCMVFKDLRVTPPTISEYQQMKPLITQQLRINLQGLMCIWHFNPENIEKRTKYAIVEN
ncbi:MAG: hypothetical protein GY869_11940 [Planctomycetes bacterium]|nr:hypothetical protein [Planctomycetota bacterium]